MKQAMNPKYQALFQPLTLPNGIELANRFSLNPLTTNSSTREGFVTDEDINYAKRRSQSAPLQVTTAAYIEDYAQLFEFGPSVRDDRFIEGLSQLAKAMKRDGAKAILQLTHAGRFAKATLKDYHVVYGPSYMHLKSPVEHDVLSMSQRKIDHVIQQYKEATRRAIEAGFDGVEISNAQRLLPQQFFSPFSNQREDHYGPQSLENRSRFGVEATQAIQEAIDESGAKNFILGFRGTPEETRGNKVGYSVDEFNDYFDRLLDVADIQYYAIASWGHDIYLEKVRSDKHKGEYVNQVVKDHVNGRVPVIATGGINSPDKALAALEHADMVGLSSVFVTEPDFVTKLAQGQEDAIDISLHPEDLADLAIPQGAFKDLVEFMDYGGSLPQATRQDLRQLNQQDTTSYFKDYQ
ncbi:NADH-dependent flavin oxidoreductase [Aerococcus urinae]|uniref:NADH-dependent flavin oxidoreductase n=2 Tax=Aerococcaceae TaxID=186827 RepID=A0A1E9PEP5_9LACT|nr:MULTISPECIES: NADH-dependent flavin oxidoreductase [Aerococcus]KAA9290715.1 NADH-dependent flavin oxidoreductase [Aerococcus mictus]MCY3035135.1 NADH-dependent flavin oxidoreductase [Aerococcus mictus]MCY3064514.1 NADH-dependent flavin oxidoreductase [Aerococcus mictus]MCY3066279.1 NADH-dependent flavin oxidoreductase [Aerococcus mictus]MCY3068203.1 NADH-dependent flavin oxidoreductase [Aerococcus mictus]